MPGIRTRPATAITGIITPATITTTASPRIKKSRVKKYSMCGIAGLFRSSGVSASDVEAVTRMTAAQIHRGPDAEGLHCAERAVLGHRRLSILDLSESGRQPMSNEDGAIWVVFNGEIYNYLELRSELLAAGHVFRSRSDTEVLVHGYEQWGVEALLIKLRGMFAFGIYDAGAG